MVEVTMMRGAQSGGTVTFCRDGRGGARGVRSRVVNGKRSDLARGIHARLTKDEAAAARRRGLMKGPRFYAGHTRFATTSKATLDGTHPHQWSPRRTLHVYGGFATGVVGPVRRRSVETFICHNGDLDFFEIGGQQRDLGMVQRFLERATGHPMPTPVDSCAIAGLFELLRCQGSWALAVRYGFCFGVERPTLPFSFPDDDEWNDIGAKCAAIFESKRRACGGSLEELEGMEAREELAEDLLAALDQPALTQRLARPDWDLPYVATAAVDGFFDHDLLRSAVMFLGGAKGSFGLCVCNALDAQRQVVLVARGQTISVAAYPDAGLVLYGSEQAAVKAALGVAAPRTPRTNAYAVEHDDSESDFDETASKASSKESNFSVGLGTEEEKASRLDLDDLGGEVCLIDWDGSSPASTACGEVAYETLAVCHGRATLTLFQESLRAGPLRRRLVRLDRNPLIGPLPASCADEVARDLSDLPGVCARLRDDWRTGHGLNRLTAHNLARQLRARLARRAEGKLAPAAVDLVVTGCEVSLWLGEQFAADLAACFPRLAVRCVSANKLLGLWGQDFPIPQTGHALADDCWDLKDALVLIVSHSGGTFGSLAVSNLLQASSDRLFVVTSEWDTQIGKQLRKLDCKMFESRIFVTGAGVRPAEPCSLTVAATHCLLTLILEHITLVIVRSRELREQTGCVLTEASLSELDRCARDNVGALEAITGFTRDGVSRPTETSKELRSTGRRWADHVLEAPRAWALCALYVLVTVAGVGAPCSVAAARVLPESFVAGRVALVLDALVYVFLGEIMTALLRLVQGRTLLHRMGTRSIVVGDVPWVAQSVEAYLSKLFACSYAYASVHVYGANPGDHLVHRMTHRVVRGALLACGRPDGRLAALTSAENAACLSVNQASSIQSLGATCESLTVGHNPFKLPLTNAAVFLPTHRPRFICEQILAEENKLKGSSGALLGAYMGLRSAKSDATTRRGSVFSGGPGRRGSMLRGTRRASTSRPDATGVVSDEISRAVATCLKEEDLHAAHAKERRLKAAYDAIASQKTGHLDFDGFSRAYEATGGAMRRASLRRVFDEADVDGNGDLDFREFKHCLRRGDVGVLGAAQTRDDAAGTTASVEPSEEAYFGASLREMATRRLAPFVLVESQYPSMRLYESRVASLQRFVAFCVMFHALAKKVADWWPRWTCGLFKYRIDRTHSIMRVATTASPVSGAELRERMHAIALREQWQRAFDVLSHFARHYKWRSSVDAEVRRRESARRGPDAVPPELRHSVDFRASTDDVDRVIRDFEGEESEKARAERLVQLGSRAQGPSKGRSMSKRVGSRGSRDSRGRTPSPSRSARSVEEDDEDWASSKKGFFYSALEKFRNSF